MRRPAGVEIDTVICILPKVVSVTPLRRQDMRMASVYQGLSANEVWRQAAEDFRQSKGVRSVDSRCGQTLEIPQAVFAIDNPRQRWVSCRTPPINIAFALAEVIWIMTGRRDLKFLEYWNSLLPKYIGQGPELHGAYGYRLRKHYGIDQLKRACDALSNNPDSRQITLQIWDSEIDLPKANGVPSDADIPCNVTSMLKVREGRLEWTQTSRSNDLFLGVPYNIVQFTFLQEIMAGWLGLDCGSYVHFSDSLHTYHHDFRKVIASCDSPSVGQNTDTINLPEACFMEAFIELERRIVLMMDPSIGKHEVHELSMWEGAPIGYRNILLVLVAESLRRRGYGKLGEELMARRCNNSVYLQLWLRWYSRMSSAV